MDEEGTSHPLEPVLHLNGRPPSPLPIPMPQKQTGIDLNPPLAEAIFKGIEDAAVEKLGTFSPFPYTFSWKISYARAFLSPLKKKIQDVFIIQKMESTIPFVFSIFYFVTVVMSYFLI